jgi:hypothetical protein
MLHHPPTPDGPVSMMAAGDYEIRIKGRVSDSLLATFDGLDAEFEPAETILHGSHLDQAALHGVLERVRMLGLELVEIRQVKAGRSP